MGLALDTTDETSGNKTVDTGDNGSIWDSLFGNAGSILLGSAGVINAFKGNTPVTNVYQSTPQGSNMFGNSNIWLYVIMFLVLIVALFLIFKN